MKISRFLLAAALLAMGATAFAATAFADGPGEADTSLQGLYLEARTADVYAGHCFANSEVGLDGQEAVLAWNVSEGTYEGVELSGLSVVAVVKAQATLGDPHDNPYPAQSVLIVDENANADQRSALIQLAHDMGGELLDNVLNVRDAAVSADFGSRPGHASLTAGELVELRTRALTHKDHLCGSEFVYYPPLTEIADAMPAYTEAHTFRGDDFNTTWSCPLKRSAFLGTFVR